MLYRTKEAFSDGVSSNKKSWYEVIQDYLKENYTPKETDETYNKNAQSTQNFRTEVL